MIKWTANYLAGIPPVFLDGLLYVLIAEFGFFQVYFGGDEAAKYIEPTTKFWLCGAIGAGAAACASLKMFRSTTYGEHVAAKEEKKNATIPNVQAEPGKDTPTP